MAKYNLRVNGNAQTIDSVYADKPLLYVLRELGPGTQLRTVPFTPERVKAAFVGKA